MKQIIILGILLVLLIGSIGAVTAESNSVTFESKENYTFVFKNETNDTLYGFCLDMGSPEPDNETVYNVSSNTSSITNDTIVKELIVKNFRGLTDANFNNNLGAAIWYFINDAYTYNQMSTTSKNMVDALDGVIGTEIGYNKYMVSDGAYNYIFEFFLARTNATNATGDKIQDMILFTFLREAIGEPYGPVLNNTTEEPDTNITEPDINNTTDDPDLNKTMTENNTNNTTEAPSVNVDDPIINNSSSVNAEIPESNNTDENIVKGISDVINMKGTGVPLIVLLLLISGLGLIVNRRK